MRRRIAHVRREHSAWPGFARVASAVFVCLAAVINPCVAFGQTTAAPVQPASNVACRVFTVGGAQDQLKELRASCNGRGLILGRVSEYNVLTNDALQATLIDARLGTQRRILLLTLQDDGQPFAEDLSGDMALAAGRGPMSGLADVQLDFQSFAVDGRVGVRGRPEDNGASKADSISIGDRIAAEHARRRTSAPQG